ncbi:uncharacterized protein N7498_010390 [Penicillium cinerascens]|uniref:Uncharacterized protein n=1 Tax=Penicillium cinerascens TaxID=70096 RepID=A0A9W9J6U3_9EURO|nr:uncharacterized protein N7498_010390 [Penicillium cinerascens]KAJ5191405.1 hypothetical protein N7498_010390 [Penicillium cinerascens]
MESVSMSDTVASGVEDFPSSIRRYPYKGKNDLSTIMSYESSLGDQNDMFLITNINKHRFETDFLDTDNKFKEYFHSSQLLVIKMASYPHEIAGRTFAGHVVSEVGLMGTQNTLRNPGGWCLDLLSSNKCPDESFLPRRLQGRGHPTVVIETARSESASKLKNDAARWLLSSNNEVQAVITIHLDRNEAITIKRWGRQNGQAVVQEETCIFKEYGSARSARPTPQVTRAPFTIPYADLYLRQAQPSTNERDIQISQEQLLDVADAAWAGI